MSTPFRIDNSQALNTVQNPIQNITLKYTFNNTPDNSVVYPTLLNSDIFPNLRGIIVFYVFCYSFDPNLTGTGSTTLLFLDNPNGDTSGDVNNILGTSFGLSDWGLKVSGQSKYIGFSSFDGGPNQFGIDTYNYPYLALQISGGSITSGTVYLQLCLSVF